jgi:hypothetical protein
MSKLSLRIAGILFLNILLGDLAALHSFADPVPVVFSAGSMGGDVELKEDPKALNGTFAHQGKDYNPVVAVSLPKDGTTFTVWIRHRGGPFQLKGTPGGQQKEIQWIWDKPTEFTWTSFGTHNRDELGDSFVIITAAKPDGDSGIDAVLIDPTNNFDPVAAKKEDLLKLAPAPAK